MGILRRSTSGWHAPARPAGIAVVTAVVAVVTLALGTVQAGASPAAAASAPALPKTPSVKDFRTVKAKIVRPPDETTHRYTPTRVTWPQAASATVALGGDTYKSTTKALTPAVVGMAAGTPISTVPLADKKHADQVTVTVLDHAKATAAGIDGVLFTLAAKGTSSASASDVQVSVDYSSFAQAQGGNYGTRLHLVRVPSCILVTPKVPSCRRLTPVSSKNNAVQQSVSAPVHLGASTAPERTATASPTTNAVSLLALTTAAAAPTEGDGGGTGGTYSATSLSPSGSWSQGGSTGSFAYSYPITLPPAASGLSPTLALGYDSGSVDGKTSSTQAQSSWIGDGWSTPESYVEQSFVPCANSPEGSASPSSTNDSCYAGPVLTLSLNGSTTALVWDADKKTWKPQDDDGSVITHVTGADTGTGTHDSDYWKVTDRNGTVYQFGRNRLPGWATGKAVTNSVQTEPVYSAHSGDPCYSSSGFTSSVCTMAYRWNLDYASDLHGNAMAYYYTAATNFYGQNKGATNVSYVRDAYLAHIDYGFRDGGAYGTPANKVVFTTSDRCVTGTCTPLSSTNAKNWPDVPFSDICASGAKCTSFAPSFFSTVRLSAISTQQWSVASAKYVTVDSYALKQTIPATGDGGAVSPTLWLSSVQRTGSDTTAGATASIALPTVNFAGDQLQNRTDTTTVALPAFYRFRMSAITTESGSVITPSYTLPNPCASPVKITASSNTSSCYPVSWTPAGYTAPITDWFNKYAVTQVTQTDPTGGAQPVESDYTYKGGAAWHYDDNEVTQAKYRTYGQFRGYAEVQTRTGAPGKEPLTLASATYYRGMSKNHNSTAVNVIDSQGGTHEDRNELAGQTLESTAYLGDGGPVDHSSITAYWVSAATATRSRTGLDALTATFVAPVEVFTRQAVTSSGSTTWRYRQTDTSYDSSPDSPTFGLEKARYAHTSPVIDTYDGCTTTKYAPANADLNLVGLTSETETDSVACGGFTSGSPASEPAGVNALVAPASVSRPAQVISDVRSFYDDTTFSTTFPQTTAPTKGDVTMSRTASTYSGGAFTYQTTARGTFDDYGRPLKAYDGNGSLTTTAYTEDSVGLTTSITTTNALSQTSITTMDPLRGLIVTATDPNKLISTLQYDALGRTTAVWRYSRATTTLANQVFSYAMSKTAITSVTSKTMTDAGGYKVSVTLYDAMLRERETQSDTGKSGRLVTEKIYDSHGWVTQTNNSWWDSATTPNSTLINGAISAIPNADVFTFDGLGRVLVDDSQKYGLTAAKSTTVYGGDRTTTVPPTGGTVQATVLDLAGRPVELDQYTSRPTLTASANLFTGLWKVTGGTTTKTTYGYDGHNQKNTTTDNAGTTWTSTYNLIGQVTAKDDPDAGTSSLQYDANGNLTQSTDSRGQSVSTTYDVLSRKTAQYAAPTSAQASSNETASWVYDNSDGAAAAMTNPIGHLTTETAYWGGAAYSTQWTKFNIFGESLGEKVTIPATTEGSVLGTTYEYKHTYSPNTGLPVRDTYAAAGGLPAESILYGYDIFDRTASVGGYGGIKYDPWDRPSQVDINGAPNQAFITNQYDVHTGQLTDALVTKQSGTTAAVNVDETVYGYDADQNLLHQTDTRNGSTAASETQCFAYDAVQRLTGAWTATDACAAIPTASAHTSVGDGLGTASAYWTTWTYNAIGERTTQVQHAVSSGTDTTATTSYNGNSTAQPHTVTATSSTASTTPATYGYDSAGNMTSRKSAQGDQTLTWNAAGQLTGVTATGKSSSFQYDAEGNLLIQKDPGSVILYLPGQQVTLDTATNTTKAVRYYALPGVVAYTSGPGATDFGYQITDRHGTAHLQLDYTAQIPTWRQSTPFGDARGTKPTAWPDNRTFLDKTTDTTTGLTNVGARYYDPASGAFVSLDPVLQPDSPQSLNGYSYANNNPTTDSDPSGLFVPIGDDQDAGRVQDPRIIDQGNQRPGHTAKVDPGTTTTKISKAIGSGRVQITVSGTSGYTQRAAQVAVPSAAARAFAAVMEAIGHHSNKLLASLGLAGRGPSCLMPGAGTDSDAGGCDAGGAVSIHYELAATTWSTGGSPGPGSAGAFGGFATAAEAEEAVVLGRVAPGETDLSRHTQRQRLIDKHVTGTSRKGNYAAGRLEDGEVLVGRSADGVHAEEDLINKAGGRRLTDLYSERQPCANNCEDLVKDMNVTWSWDWNPAAVRPEATKQIAAYLKGLYK